jgi:serine/threonine-protein kinase
LPADRWASAQEFAVALAREDATPTSAATATAAPVSIPEASARSARIRRVGSWAVPLIGVAVGAVAASWIAAQREERSSPVRFALTFDDGVRFLDNRGVSLALSPDGQVLVFNGEKDGRNSLYVRPLGSLRARELPGTEDAIQPFFSPDGKWVGYYANSQLRKTPVSGGPSVPIADATGFWGASWYTDNEIVISMDGTLAVVPASGGKPRVFAQSDSSAGNFQMRFPLVLADGKTVLYTAFGAGGVAAARIGVASLDGGRPRTLDLIGTDPVAVIDKRLIYASAAGAIMAAPFDEGRARVLGPPEPVIDEVVVGGSGPLKAAVSRSGSLVYVSGSSTQHIVLAEPHGQARPIFPEAGRYDHPRLSPDGKQLAFEVGGGAENSIYIFDIPSATLARLTTGSNAFNPEWSPDGKRVIFITSTDPTGPRRARLVWQPADRSAPPEVLYESKRALVLDGALSSDGSTLVIRVDGATTPYDIWYRRLTGDTSTRVLVSSRATEVAPRISPDGKWVAYTSDESGRNQVYVTPLPGPGGRVQVSANGGAQPVWSADNRRLFYSANGGLMAATLSFTPTVRVESREKLFDVVKTGPPTHAAYDVARDGKHFVLLQSTGAEAQLIVVHDWKDELRASSAKPNR